MRRKRSKNHGMRGTKVWNAWHGMLERCQNQNHPAYKYYGGRGIVVCERWAGENGFLNFLADMGNPPSKLHSIDRINNDGNYEPENLRWATTREQNRNKSTNMVINGQILADIERGLGMKKGTISSRTYRGWSIDKAISQPVRNPFDPRPLERSVSKKLTKEQILEIFNSPLIARKLASKYNVSMSCVHYIKSGRTWSHITGRNFKNNYSTQNHNP